MAETKDIEFVRAAAEDLRKYLPKLLKEQYLGENPQMMIDRLRNQPTYVLRHNKKDVGIINLGLRPSPFTAKQEEFYLRLIYIKPEARKQGIGKSVLKKLHEKYKGNLWAMTYPENTAARKMFRSAGFKEIGKRKLGKETRVIFISPGKPAERLFPPVLV